MRSQIEDLKQLRRRLEGAFRPDTASEGFSGTTPSTGHCAAVSAIVRELLGGELISTSIQDQSHWINRVELDGHTADVDLTGDQFGLPAMQIGQPGELYPGLRVRSPGELTPETLKRASLLAERAGLDQVARALRPKLGPTAGVNTRRA